MTQPWIAEQEVSADLARDLIAAQFPALAPVRIALMGVGWDNTAFVVNDAYVFRFPRRTVAVSLLETENRALPFLAARLPIPIPNPIYVGKPEARFSWPFSGYRRLVGRTACSVGLDDAQRLALAPQLAGFLAVLHALSAEEATAAGAGPDPIDRLNLTKRIPMARQRLEEAVTRGVVRETRPYATILDAAETLPPLPGRMAPAHGDLYSRHLLLDAQGHLSGVIDWGDLHVGSPAVDLAVAHLYLPPDAHAAFRAAYGPIDPITWEYARFHALRHSLSVAAYTHDVGDADLLREALTSLAYIARRD